MSAAEVIVVVRLRAEVVPNSPRYYEYVKYFEENPRVVMSRISKVCRRGPEEVYAGGGVRVFTYDCGGVVVDAVVAERGVTVYVSTPGIRHIENVSIIIGTVVGSLIGFLGGYCGSLLTGLLAGAVSYVASVWCVRRYLMGRSEFVELFERIKEL